MCGRSLGKLDARAFISLPKYFLSVYVLGTGGVAGKADEKSPVKLESLEIKYTCTVYQRAVRVMEKDKSGRGLGKVSARGGIRKT